MQIGPLETCSIWTIAMIQSGSDDQSFWFSAQSQSGARVVTDRPQFCTHKTSHLTRILYPKGLASWIIMDVCAMYKGQHHFLHFRRGRCQKGTLTGHPVERLWTPLLKRHKGAIFTWESWDYCRGFDNNHVSFITSFFLDRGNGQEYGRCCKVQVQIHQGNPKTLQKAPPCQTQWKLSRSRRSGPASQLHLKMSAGRLLGDFPGGLRP